MNKILKVIFLSLIFFVFLASPLFAQENQDQIDIYFFYGDGCPHCAKEKIFLKNLEEKDPDVNVNSYEVWYNKDNQKLLREIAKQLDIRTSGVPITIVNSQLLYGYLSDQTTGKRIEEIVDFCKINECEDPVKGIIGEEIPEQKPLKTTEAPTSPSPKTTENTLPEKINLPILGEVDVRSLSLPLLTIIIGGLDGFNPCAMWVLIFLIGLLLGMDNRRRMWTLGTVFIVASGVVYFIFMAAWLNLILFLGFIIWVRVVIGFIALLSGAYNVREYYINKSGACKVTGSERRQKIFAKLKDLTHKKKFWLALGGIILLAFAVNLVELICSAGLPAIYTQVLTLTNLPKWQYYLYLLLYIFIFMLDDLIVFIIAMVTLKVTGISGKYSRYSSLIGGIIMLIVGALLILRPEWLMFG